MNAKELRIGNYVNLKGHNELCIVNDVDPKWVNLTIPASGMTDDNEETKDLTPIKITDEILLSAGFIYEFSSFVYKTGELIRIIIQKLDDDFHLSLGGGKTKQVKYLHRLQNLIYELADLEITINEKALK